MNKLGYMFIGKTEQGILEYYCEQCINDRTLDITTEEWETDFKVIYDFEENLNDFNYCETCGELVQEPTFLENWLLDELALNILNENYGPGRPTISITRNGTVKLLFRINANIEKYLNLSWFDMKEFFNTYIKNSDELINNKIHLYYGEFHSYETFEQDEVYLAIELIID